VPRTDAVGGEDEPVFLAVAFTSGADEQVIPFLEHGLSPEYEVTRAIRLVARTSRKRLGVVDTDAGILGGLDQASGRWRLPWAIVRELRRQYEVVQLDPSSPISDPVDALLVVQPSMLLQRPTLTRSRRTRAAPRRSPRCSTSTSGCARRPTTSS